ncbi:hypothetical protein RugamoR1_58310 [Rugamonas sp. R1(2021)]
MGLTINYHIDYKNTISDSSTAGVSHVHVFQRDVPSPVATDLKPAAQRVCLTNPENAGPYHPD